MKLSQICATPEELRQVEKTYDAVICGSDQVWNPRAIFKDFDAFLLGTADCKKLPMLQVQETFLYGSHI